MRLAGLLRESPRGQLRQNTGLCPEKGGEGSASYPESCGNGFGFSGELELLILEKALCLRYENRGP